MLDELITRASLEELAGTGAFERGEEYFSAGAVGRLRATADEIVARVAGSETYRVELRHADGRLVADCTCPRAADGFFCKHCVAVGLAWLAENPAAPKTRAASTRKKRRDPWRDIKAHLMTQTPATLVERLLDVARRDDRLYQTLLLEAERDGGGNVVAAYRTAIDGATHVHDYLDWREAGVFAGDLDQVADALEELLKPETASMLVELAEYAIESAEHSLEHIDDSNGEAGECVGRFGELHRRACAMARPEPTALAERLFRLETTLPFHVCSFDAVTYRKALGKDGLRRYRELAEAEWRKLKPRDPGDRYDAHRAAITGIMERLAEASGNVDELVAIKSTDLSSGFRYLAIAEIWSKAGQPDKALDWAERGLRAFSDRPDDRLRDFLVAAYLKRKRNDDALQLTWVQFEEQPSLEHYEKPHGVAGKIDRWPEQRHRALRQVAEVIARGARTTNRWKPQPSTPDYSLRVQIALWEKDLDAAWSAAHEGACDRSLLMMLAGQLASSRPGDAVSLYRRVVPPIIAQTSNAAYDEAIKLIRKIGALMNAQHQSREFADYLAELRVQFKPKRNFIKLLDGVARATAGRK